MKMSDAFEKPGEEACLEFKAIMLNVNFGHNRELMEKCKTLYGYSVYVAKVKKYGGEMGLTDAIDKAVEECIQEDVLKEFLSQHRSEVFDLTLTEYDEATVLRQIREEALEEGIEQGLERGLEQGLERGLERGLEQGLEQGHDLAIREMAFSLLGVLDEKTIAEKTGLSLDEIRRLN